MNDIILPDKAALLAKVKAGRDHWDRDFRPAGVERVNTGEESVWDYPRPPILVPAPATIMVKCDGHIIAQSDAALDMKETAGAPCPYLPPKHVRTDWLSPNGDMSICEWKGVGVSHDLHLPNGRSIKGAAWTYPDPFDDLQEGYVEIAGWFSFYPNKVECFVSDERVRPQPGGFYGGWVTDRIKGPIKGLPGTGHW
jgi:uncharacterized protein (DUF427 family)